MASIRAPSGRSGPSRSTRIRLPSNHVGACRTISNTCGEAQQFSKMPKPICRWRSINSCSSAASAPRASGAAGRERRSCRRRAAKRRFPMHRARRRAIAWPAPGRAAQRHAHAVRGRGAVFATQRREQTIGQPQPDLRQLIFVFAFRRQRGAGIFLRLRLKMLQQHAETVELLVDRRGVLVRYRGLGGPRRRRFGCRCGGGRRHRRLAARFFFHRQLSICSLAAERGGLPMRKRRR